MNQPLELQERTKIEGLYTTAIESITDALKQQNVKVIYNYPGRPASLLAEHIKKNCSQIQVQDYLPNEFVATAKGLGSSVAGEERSLVLFKDVGTNLASDHLHCINHIGVNKGLVFFVCDDPSAWYSQNEQDSRGIYHNAELPFFEPFDQHSAYYCIHAAYELSEIVRLPFFVRATGRLFAESFNPNVDELSNCSIPRVEDFESIPFDAEDSWKSIFGTVERQRLELIDQNNMISQYYDEMGLNVVKGTGSLGVIASGFLSTQIENEKLLDDGMSLLKLATVYPLPEKTLLNYISEKQRIMVIDQGEPLLEVLIRDLVQRNGLPIPVLGKLNGYVPRVGEFRDKDLALSIQGLKTNKPQTFPTHKKIAKAPAYKKDDGYRVLLTCLKEAVKEVGCRPLYAGDAGQPCQIPDTPGFEDMLHMETTMGGCISFLSGGIESYKRSGTELPFKPIAYVGDSDFFHSAFPSIAEAIAKDHPILMILVDNQGAVSTGRQPHLGMKTRYGIKELSIKKILESMNPSTLKESYAADPDGLKEKLIAGLKSNNFYGLIVHTD